jgi:hypothetical protein
LLVPSKSVFALEALPLSGAAEDAVYGSGAAGDGVESGPDADRLLPVDATEVGTGVVEMLKAADLGCRMLPILSELLYSIANSEAAGI